MTLNVQLQKDEQLAYLESIYNVFGVVCASLEALYNKGNEMNQYHLFEYYK